MSESLDRDAIVVKYLLKRRGEIVSGEELSFELGISRVALNKRVKKLVERGVPIKSIERKGYILEEEPDVLIPEVIKAYLENPLIGNTIHALEVVDSTNRLAKELAAQGEREGTVIVADYQTAGKGRMGRKWFSPPGKNLYFSAILRPKISPLFLYQATMAASVSVCEVLRQKGVDALIKWPNDIYASGKKLCGVLNEADIKGHGVNFVILGIGINVNIAPEEFPVDIASIATSVFAQTGKFANRAKLLAEVLDAMYRWYVKLIAGETASIFSYWRTYNYTIGKRVVVDKGLEGETVGITPSGELLVRNGDGKLHAIASGDVVVKLNLQK